MPVHGQGGAHYFAEAAGPPSRSYHGFYSHMHEFLDGWDLDLDGAGLGHAAQANVFPDRLVRQHAGVVETVTLLDADAAGAALTVVLAVAAPARLGFVPRVDIRYLWEEVRPEYDVRWDAERRARFVASRRPLPGDVPARIGIACSEPWDFHAAPAYDSVT